MTEEKLATVKVVHFFQKAETKNMINWLGMFSDIIIIDTDLGYISRLCLSVL